MPPRRRTVPWAGGSHSSIKALFAQLSVSLPSLPTRLPAPRVIYEAGTCLQLNRDCQLLGEKPHSCHQLGITFRHQTQGEGLRPESIQDTIQCHLLLNLNGQEKWLAIKFLDRYYTLCRGAPLAPGHGCPCRVLCFVTRLEKTDPNGSQITANAISNKGWV